PRPVAIAPAEYGGIDDLGPAVYTVGLEPARRVGARIAAVECVCVMVTRTRVLDTRVPAAVTRLGQIDRGFRTVGVPDQQSDVPRRRGGQAETHPGTSDRRAKFRVVRSP